ncbi:MAG TPA: LysR substrate-binding domain-containing protein [Steroidobacteraceae bacterium]|nr:LysR substrate-binding domain-containing protein [Steroidobacteraceae bacterium]
MNNRTHRLPPLPALRAFEAVARVKSVRDAAEELGLTASAISHQLRNLEEALGVALFVRGNQSIELTDSGEQFAAYAFRGFRELRQGVAALRSDPESRVLRVSAAPMFAMEILLPALPDFERACPDIQLRLEVGESVADLEEESIDAAIRIGREPSNLFFEKLLDVCWAPVCAPSLLRGPKPIRVPNDLREHILVATSEEQCVQLWLDAANVSDLKPSSKLTFDSFLGCVQAAENGMGFAIAPLSMLSQRLAEGKLVAPFGISVPSPFVYRLVCRRGRERQPKIDRFRRWLIGICEAHAAKTPLPCAKVA